MADQFFRPGLHAAGHGSMGSPVRRFQYEVIRRRRSETPSDLFLQDKIDPH